MTEVYFYHYTSVSSAIKILRKGEIKPSVAVNGDAIHGDDVYLTTLEPRLGPSTIKKNNWDCASAAVEKKIELYFEMMIPLNKVTMANETRDIQVYKGPLELSLYRWNLKTWEGELLSTQYFMITSDGKAKEKHPNVMGRYTLVRDTVVMWDVGDEIISTSVYKKDDNEIFLYVNMRGLWCVSDTAGKLACSIMQPNDGEFSLSPSKTLPWKYSEKGAWMDDDHTLKVFPCYG